MRILPCYAAGLTMACLYLVLCCAAVVCISPSCCAAVISMLGLRTALCCAVDFVCCLCTAAAACILLYIVRLLRPVLLIRGCPCFPFCVFCCHMAAA